MHKIVNDTHPSRDIILKMPKIEVHRHLEGTYPIKSLFKMAMKNNLDVPSDIDTFKKTFQFPKNHKPDFLLFLSKFKKFWYKSIDDVKYITLKSVEALADENIFYIELRFNPLHFTELTNLDPCEVTQAIIETGDSAAKKIGLHIRYILTFNRGIQTANEMIHTYKLLHNSDLSRVVGIDLAGDEINYPPELFTPFFDLVKKDGQFRIDIHAGEVTDTNNIWTSIDQLHADRIGHGVSAINDPKLQNVLKEKQIFLAQCITSNYQTGAWEDEPSHPMKDLVESGVPVTIASDDPTIQDSLLTDDYMKAIVNFNWNIDSIIQLNLKSFDSTFLTNQEKDKLKKEYLLSIESFKNKFRL
ncbi:MAG: adenosine deaminase [Spirochaeta sp. LUC14_002_19_P3]|nr:MAG: adenosine deaminase [Spirochaeta sp. LUC14_002_19_P3]